MSSTPAKARYDRALLLLSLTYGGLVFAVAGLFRLGAPVGWPAYAAALLPALPIIGLFAAMGRYLAEETDEYVRMLAVRQIVVASGATLTLATLYGVVQGFGLAPAVNAFWVAIVWFAGLGLGKVANRLGQARAA